MRGIAVLMILYGHMGTVWLGDDLYELSRLYIQPGTGVDLFFCISGYVITSHFARAIPKDVSFVQFAVPFWIRRFWRLAPTAWLWLSLLFLVSMIADNTAVFYQNIYDILAAVFEVANYRLYICRVGLAVCGREAYFWSLSLEEQFYLLFPFVVFLFSRRMLIALMIAIIALQIGLARTALLWLIRTDALAFGVLIALLQQNPAYDRLAPTILSGRVFRYLPVLLCTTAIAILEAPKFQFVSFPTGLVAISSAVFVYLASFERDYAVPPGVLRSLLIFLGTRSYALYIIHVPIIWFVALALEQLRGQAPSALLLAVVTPAAMFVAVEANYRFVEMPLRLYGVRAAANFRSRRSQEIVAA
jgi:peptidoglycan/LPS O-acetylase OafA/YrhL